jgi:hypothetical protein
VQNPAQLLENRELFLHHCPVVRNRFRYISKIVSPLTRWKLEESFGLVLISEHMDILLRMSVDIEHLRAWTVRAAWFHTTYRIHAGSRRQDGGLLADVLCFGSSVLSNARNQ